MTGFSDKVLMVLIDALRWDYLNAEDAPFLYSLLEKGIYVRNLKIGPGFCERSEILTGAHSDQTDNFIAFTYAPNQSPFKQLGKCQFLTSTADWVSDTIPKLLGDSLGRVFDKAHGRLRSRLTHVCRRFGGYALNRIPFQFLHLFALTEDSVDHTEPGAFLVPSLFDLAREAGLSWYYAFPTLATDLQGTYDENFKKLVDSFSQPYNLYLFAIGHLDTICHTYGTSRESRQRTLKQVDEWMKFLYEEFTKVNPEGTVLFFGDHGMVEVEQLFDAESRLLTFVKKRQWHIPRDLVYFLDSTMVRVWGRKSEECRELFDDEYWKTHGQVINEELAQRFNIPIHHRRYGDVIWWADPGVCVFPDFFRRHQPPKGMHGYDPNHDDMKGTAIVVGSSVPAKYIEEGLLVDICPTVEKMLGLTPPEKIVGKSWI